MGYFKMTSTMSAESNQGNTSREHALNLVAGCSMQEFTIKTSGMLGFAISNILDPQKEGYQYFYYDATVGGMGFASDGQRNTVQRMMKNKHASVESIVEEISSFL